MPKDAQTLGLVFNYEGELLHQAAIYDQDQLIGDLLNAGGSGTVKSVDPEGRTPLHTAASHGSVKCVKALLSRGADPNAISGIEDNCSTPVHHAAKAGHLACLASLLEYEVNLDLKNSNGKKALDVALGSNASDCRKCAEYIKKKMVQRKKEMEVAMCEELYDVIDDGLFSRAKEILETISDPYAVINRYYRGPNTLLYRASFGGHLKLVNLLIEYKADGRPNADSGITPLYAACHNSHYDVAARLSEVYPKQLTLPATHDETYPIHVSIMRGHVDILNLLLKFCEPPRDVTVRKASVQEEQTKHPIKKRASTASLDRSYDLVKDEKEENYYVDINKPIRTGYTPLHLAVLHGGKSLCQPLLKCGTIVNLSQTISGIPPGALVIDSLANEKTPFQHAILLNKVDVMALFLKYGVDIHQSMADSSGFSITPLQHACHMGYEEMVKLLLENGAQDIDNIARIEAVKNGRENIVQIVLNQDVQESEYDMVLAASEMEHALKSVSISWHKKGLESLKEDWIINSGINLNSSDMALKLQSDMGLTLKLFTSIDLSGNSLETLPPILFQMPSLKFLYLSDNKVKTIPTASSKDASFDEEGTDDANGFGMFTMNWNCPSLETLDMSHNKLKEIPKNVFEMPSLQTANFSWNQITSIPFEMWISPSLKTLILEHNCLKNLPMLLGHTSGNVTKKAKAKTTPPNKAGFDNVDAKKKDFATMSPFYSKRPSWNEESDESDDEEIEVLKRSGISRLDVSDNELTVMPPGLPCLAPNLARLNLSKNKISDLDSLNFLPEHLMALDLSGNGLKHFNLMGGKEENIVNNMCYAYVRKHNNRQSYPQAKRKSCIHKKHKQLTDLNRLNLSKNSLDNLHVCYGGDNDKHKVLFPDLKILDISNNRLLKVPKGIGRLSNLSSFMVSNNPNVTVLPSELGLCTGLYELKIDNLHLKDPPRNVIENAIQDGRMDVRSLTGYLKSLHDNAQLYPNIKLMIVGVHGIGKTTLLDALRKEGHGSYRDAEHKNHFNDRRRDRKLSGNLKSNQSTVGVDVSDWVYGKKLLIKFSTWDFAGQTEYYATHQCFLSKRAMYLVLWKITDGFAGIEQMEQWLLNIQERAPNCSVIIIGSFLDKAEKKRKGYVEEMRTEIYRRFVSTKFGGGVGSLVEKGLPKVVDVVEVSCQSQRSVAKVRDLIYDTVLNLKISKSSKSLLETKIPKSYIDVEKVVTQIKEELNSRSEMPVLNKEDFRKRVFEHLTLCGCELRNGDEELDQAVQFLHDYGILLHYDDPALNDLYFVDPQWLCDMLAHVVTVRSVNPFIKNGVLKISDLKSQIFKGEKRFPTEMVMKYVELMSKFEVAIKISEKFLLIPSLLPDKQKECPVLTDHESADLRNAMNVSAYLDMSVIRRQYLMSYVPSGLWARLLTRLIADNRICKIVSQCCDIQGNTNASSEQVKIDSETLMRAAPPEWACWKTGIELSCFGAKLLRVCQLESNEPYYGGKNSLAGVYVKSRNAESIRRVAIEIVAPCLQLTIEKFHQFRPSEDGSEGQNLVGFRVVGINNSSPQTACKLLVITVEHIDNLLSEWYPKIDTFVDLQGVKAIRRVSFCDRCVREAIEIKGDTSQNSHEEISGKEVDSDVPDPELAIFTAYDALDDELSVDGVNIMFQENGDIVNHFEKFNTGQGPVDFDTFGLDEEEKELMIQHRELGKGHLIAFELEEASKLLRENKALLCPFHLQLDPKNVFPDLCFLDMDAQHIIHSDQIKQGKLLGSGAYGDVFHADLSLSNKEQKTTVIPAAMKIPMNSEKDKKRKIMATMFSYDTYRNVRQELAILGSINHVNIIRFYGVSITPFAMLLELAPLGALDNRYKDYWRLGKKINPYVIQKSLQQISSALKYLHRHHIIYRDLKAENVLVLAFPSPNVVDPVHHQVLLKLTDYGISRSVSLGGIKGFLGTPGFMAPEILRYTGKESYTDKVDCFSFGSLMYELIALQHPYSDVANDKARLAQLYMQNGKRPRLTSREKRSPVLLLSLLYRCWAQHPEDRPSAAEINGLTSLEEFPKLSDTLGLGEDFNLQCVATANQSRIDCSVVDSRIVVGSHLWFCGYKGFGASVSARKEGFISVFSYHNGKYTHANNLKIYERIVQICSVGTSVWIGTENGHVQVFCALTYKPIGFCFLGFRIILKILHSPVCNTVLVSVSDGSVYAFDDNVSKYTETIPQKDVVEIFHKVDRTTTIRKLVERTRFSSDFKIHCMAGLMNRARDTSQVETGNHGNSIESTTSNSPSPTATDSSKSGEVTYELWCGQDKGRITILEINNLKTIRTLPVNGNDLSDVFNEAFNVQFIETSRTFDSAVNKVNQTPTPPSANYGNFVWVVAYPGTMVSRWNVEKRVLENSMDASQHYPWHDLNSSKAFKKSKGVRSIDAQIYSLLVVEDTMYIGTTSGCFLVCNAFEMTPRLSVRCYEEFIQTIIPLRMITSRNPDEGRKKLILTCGRKCLDAGIRNIDRKKKIVSKETTILAWAH